jgi:hypothetical protein
MGNRIRQGLRVSLKNKLVIISAAAGIASIALFISFFGYFNTGIQKQAVASGTQTIPSGSFIINMGIVPQSFSNALKPYGMIYELTNTHNVPVKWVIEPTKSKDGNDFTHNGVNYRSGAFIIPAPFITPEITTVINNWVSAGVVGNYSVSGMTLPVQMDITSFPRVLIDTLSMNDTIITNYFNNAAIPSSAYTKGSPAQVTACHDMWINPHGDPTWATHYYLHDFVTVQKSFIWMQCHSVSMMESCKNTVAPFTQLNYLTTAGLQCFQSGKCQSTTEVHAKASPGSPAYFYPADPVMQFLGGVSSITSGGSERWFIPTTTSAWRSTTRRLLTVGTTPSPREGVQMVYGPAYGDTTNGQVMYMGGHDMNSGNIGDMVAGQRSFFNFLLIAGKRKSPVLSATIPGNINANASGSLTVSVTGGAAPYSYNWISSNGGTFTDPTSATTTYTAPHTETPLQIILTCVVTDACGRRNFYSTPVIINASPLPINLLSFTGKVFQGSKALLQWTTASEINNKSFTIERSKDGNHFTLVNIVPSKGNSATIQYYSLVDGNPHPGISYYRLSQTDIQGTVVLLKTIKLDVDLIKAGRKINAWPNPFREVVTVGLPDLEEGEATIEIRGLHGRLFVERKIQIDASMREVTIENLGHLPSGNYIITLSRGNETMEGFKIVKY